MCAGWHSIDLTAIVSSRCLKWQACVLELSLLTVIHRKSENQYGSGKSKGIHVICFDCLHWSCVHLICVQASGEEKHKLRKELIESTASRCEDPEATPFYKVSSAGRCCGKKHGTYRVLSIAFSGNYMYCSKKTFVPEGAFLYILNSWLCNGMRHMSLFLG